LGARTSISIYFDPDIGHTEATMSEREDIELAPVHDRAVADTAAASNNGMAVAPVELGAIGRLAENNAKFGALSGEAKIAADQEQSMTILEAIKLYPKAIAWSVVFSSAIAMEGFDLVLISAFFAFPPFTERYGVLGESGSYQIPAPWQAALGNGARVGEILGLLLNGWLCERFGFKKTMIGSLLLLMGLIFIQFFAQNIEMLVVGAVLLGFPWGVFQTITTA
jgi:SP family general alpha glucoside:H+ symporter-like MFS transporter